MTLSGVRIIVGEWSVDEYGVESGWIVTAHGDAWEGKWRGNWRMEWVASTLHTTSEHGVSSITTADAHTSAASSRLNWRPRLFKCTRPFRRKTKSCFCECAITFQTQTTCGIKTKIISVTTCLSATMFTTNPTWTGLVLKPGLCLILATSSSLNTLLTAS